VNGKIAQRPPEEGTKERQVLIRNSSAW